MKRKTLIRCVLCLLVLLIAELSVIGFSEAKYAKSYNVTSDLSVTINATKYTLTMDANGGAFEDASVTKTIKVTYKDTYKGLPAPVREGYSFDGWYTEKNGGTEIKSGDTVEITQNTTVYARWKANTYEIEYNSNGGTGSMADTTATYGQNVTLRANTYSRTGYTFNGWNTKADGTGTAYADKATVKDLTASTSVTLYAQWKANTYTVNLYSNLLQGMDNTSSAVTAEAITYSISNGAVTATGINRDTDCYGFTSGRVWLETGKTYRFSTTHTGTYVTDVELFFMYNGSYAQLNGQNTWVHMSAPSYNFSVIATGEYWMRMDINKKGQTHTLSNINIAESKGSIGVTYGNTYSALPTLSRTGYTFLGWKDKDGNSYTTSTAVSKTSDHDLYAQWQAHKYTVKFNANNGSGSMPNQAFTYGMAQTLSANTFTRSGYTFGGWNTKADGTGTAYTNTASVKDLTSQNGATVTLYAQWVARPYTIKFYANGGSGTMPDQVAEFDKVITLSKNQFTRAGYTFLGWAKSAGATTHEYIDQQDVVNLAQSGTVNLYAIWAEKTYTVTFDYNGGSGSPQSTLVVYNKPYGTLPTYPRRDGYLFNGWYTAASGGTRVYPTTTVTQQANHTLYAHWIESPANTVISDLVVKNNPDDDNNGIVDDIYMNFTCGGFYEKFNIPIVGLKVGKTYKLTYSASNDGTFGSDEIGYGQGRYASGIVNASNLTVGNIKTAVATDAIATWNDRPKGKAWLNGPHNNRTIIFTATDTTMYWAWEFGIIQDHERNNFNISDIRLEEYNVPASIPKMEFKNITIYGNEGTEIIRQLNSPYSTNISFKGAGMAEKLFYPITGLTVGVKYTITFQHTFYGKFNYGLNYGCGIASTEPDNNPEVWSLEAVSNSWLSNRIIFNPDGNGSKTGYTTSNTLTFTATEPTAYWIWYTGGCQDGNEHIIDVNITNFTGGSTVFYDRINGSWTTLQWMPDVTETNEIELIWDGIDDTNMDIWYPVDEQHPIAGDSYELAFEPAEGCAMAETITVTIDDIAYVVYTDGRINDGETAPVYDPVRNVLVIPTELLTPETGMVSITASAVEIVDELEETESIEDAENSADTADDENAEAGKADETTYGEINMED